MPVARMLQAAQDNQALSEVLIIASAISVQDLRERPLDKQTQADQAHKKFSDDKSDFFELSQDLELCTGCNSK